jgi:hypothetical protein
VVAGGLGVDGDGRPFPEVGTAPAVLFAHGLRHPRGLGLHLRREGVGEPVFRHHDLEVHAGVLETAEDLDDAARGVARGGGRPHDLGQDHLARLRAPALPRRDEELVQDAAVEGHDVAAEASVALVASHQPLLLPLEDADDAALGALGRRPLEPGHHPVAVEGFLHVDGRHVEVGRLLALGDDEPEAAGVALEAAHHQVHARGQADAGAADLDHGAVRQEAAEDGLQLLAAVGVEAEAAHELADGGGLAVTGEEVEDSVVEGHGGSPRAGPKLGRRH